MIELKKKNVHRIVETEAQAAALESDGFKRVVFLPSAAFDKMTVKELLAYTAEHGLEVDEKANKPEILEAIRAASE